MTTKETSMPNGLTREGLRAGVSRRNFNKLLATMGVSTAAASLPGRFAYAAEQVYLYIMGGYADKALFKEYAEKNGGNPTVALWADEEEALLKLRSGLASDVNFCGSYSVDRWRDAGVIQPIDPARLTHWNELFSGVQKVPDMERDGKLWWVPVGFGTTSIVYRTDLVDFKEESWSLLWDERYAGRLAMYDNTADGVAAAALYASVNPYTMDDAAIAKVKAAMLKQKPLLRMYTTDSTVLSQAMASGEIVAASAANDVYAQLKAQGVPVGYMLAPKEGILTWAMGLTISKDAKRLDQAYDLINSMMSKDSGMFWTSKIGYPHANEQAYASLSDEELMAVGLPRDVFSLLAKGVFESRMANEDRVAKMFEEVKASL